MNATDGQRIRRIIEYQRLRISSGDETQVKRGLQDLTSIFRSGYSRFVDRSLRSQIELLLLGLLQSKVENPKLLMWTLNALAFVGKENTSLNSIISCIQNNEENTPVVAAGIAALQKICRRGVDSKATKRASHQILILASLQHIHPSKLDVASARIDIDKADPELLKLGLILVGTDKAPDNLFHPNHSNAELVKALGGHDHPIVKQYSCWATAENPELGFAHLGIPMKSIQEQPPSVRAWMYEVLCRSGPENADTIEYIEEGSRDLSERAQAGLSHGLRTFYIDGIEPTILDWYSCTENAEIRQNLEFHMVAHAEDAVSYCSTALDAFVSSRIGSQERANLLSAAVGKPIYLEMKKLEAKGDPSLFTLPELLEGKDSNVTQNFTFGDNAQIGALAGVGNANNSGDLTINDVESFQKALAQLAQELSNSGLNQKQRDELRTLIGEAQKEPSKSSWLAISKWVHGVNDKVVSAVASGEAWAKLLVAICSAGSLF